MPDTWTNAMPGMTQSVPAAVQSGRVDPYELIKNLVTPELVTAATSPVPGSHAQGVPSAFTTPIAPHQDRPMDQRQLVGRRASNRQAISNAFTGATNALGAVVTKEAQIKQNQIRDAAQKVIMAQQAIDEAKQAHDAAVASGDAATASKMQAVMQQNQQARDAIFADPKMRKALVKGFDISYTDPQSNKTENHAAIQEALKNAKSFAEKKAIMQEQQQKQNQAAGQQAGVAFEKSQPQGLAPNIQAQQQLAIAQATQKLQSELASKLLTVQGANNRAAFIQASQNLRQMQNQSFMAQKIDQVFQQNQHLANLRHTYRLNEIGAHITASSTAALNLFRQEHLDPTVLEEFQTKTTQNFIRDEGTLATALQKAQGDYATANSVFSDPKTTKVQRDQATQVLNDAKASIYSLQAQQRNLQSYKDNFYKMVSNLKNVGSGSGNAGAEYSTNGNAGTGSGTGNSESVSTSAGDTDEEDNEWDQDINFFINAGLPEFQQK